MNGRLLAFACVAAALAALLRPASAVTADVEHGLHPMAGDAAIPQNWLPPGSANPDTGPSSVVYPPQKLTLRFNHQKHVKEVGAKCDSCHGKVKTSTHAEDDLIPAGATCDTCHDTDHSDLKNVKPGSEDMGQCKFCHIGYRESAPQKVAAFTIPKPNMRFNHKAHLDRKINCAQCHGSVDQLELATRDQLPRMKGCFGCHNMSGPAQGQAKSDCNVCHVTENSGELKTLFATGALQPPRWLGNAQHGPDFIERHKRVAADNSALCTSCHKENFCSDCHDGKVRPRSVHPNDWISMHPIAARQDNPRCISCHQEQTFCQECHQRVGLGFLGPNFASRGGGTFHPDGWNEIRKSNPRHHSWEAQRNLNACVSCHTENECVGCHGAGGSNGRTGAGNNPHPSSFAATCRTQYARNPRPCLVCHEDPLAACP